MVQSEWNMSLLAVKVSAMAIVFAVSFIGGLLPCVAIRKVSAVTKSSARFRKVLSLVNCFSGGIFLGASLLSVLPEAAEAMEPVFDYLNWEKDFPVVEAFIGFGFILVLFIEAFANECCGGHLEHNCHGNTENKENAAQNGNKTKLFNNGALDLNRVNNNAGETIIAVSMTSKGIDNEGFAGNGIVHSEATTIVSADNGVNNKTQTAGGFSENSKTLENPSIEEHVKIIYDEDITTEHAKPVAKIRMMVFGAALSIHMIFDGLAVGLLKTPLDIWQLLLPICLHKVLVFFSIGIAVSETLVTVFKSVLAVFFIALVSPVGISLGILLNYTSDNTGGVVESSVSAFLQSTAVGTFLYVTCFEILHPEFALRRKGGPLRVTAVVFGYGIMLILRKFTSD